MIESPSRFASLQAGELDWWKNYLKNPTAKQRMWATYGARYLPFFYKEFQNVGKAVEIGSGPLPVLELMQGDLWVAVDTLAKEYSSLTNAYILPSTELLAKGEWDTVLLLNVLDHTTHPINLCLQAADLLVEGGKVLVFMHLDHEDDKHVRFQAYDVQNWLKLAELRIEREGIIETNEMDPFEAYVAVAAK